MSTHHFQLVCPQLPPVLMLKTQHLLGIETDKGREGREGRREGEREGGKEGGREEQACFTAWRFFWSVAAGSRRNGSTWGGS